MISDIVRELLRDAPDQELVGELTDRSALLPAIQELAPDVVVVGMLDADVGPDWDRLFVTYPKLRVMAVSPDGRRAGTFTELAPRSLLEELRKTAALGKR